MAVWVREGRLDAHGCSCRLFHRNSHADLPVPRCIGSQGGEARADWPKRVLHPTFVGIARLNPFIYGFEVGCNTGSLQICKDAVLNNTRIYKYDPEDKRKRCEERGPVRQRRLITRVEKSLVPGNERTEKVHGVISAPSEGRKLRPEQCKGGSRLQRNELVDRSEKRWTIIF